MWGVMFLVVVIRHGQIEQCYDMARLSVHFSPCFAIILEETEKVWMLLMNEYVVHGRCTHR